MALAADHQVVVDGDAQTAYGAAKMAVLGLMNCLAIEGRKNKILVNALSPGVATRMTRSLISSASGFARMQFFETKGVQFDPTKPVTVDMFDAAYAQLSDLSTASPSPLGVLGDADQRLKALGLI